MESDIQNTFSLLMFQATPDCESVNVPLVGGKPLAAWLKDGDMFIGNYNEGNCHYYAYYIRTDGSGNFRKVIEPVILPIGNVSELRELKSGRKKDSDEEPRLKATCQALPWYIATFHWIKSELGYHAAKLYKDEFLGGIDEYYLQQD